MKKAALLSALLAMVTTGAMAKDWTEIRMAAEGAYPPFNATNADGSMRGLDIDIGNALCEQMKAKCTWVRQEWDGVIPALITRKFDVIMSSMTITDERRKKVDFTNKYYSSPLALVAKENSSITPDDVGTLKGKKIGVYRGTVGDTFATQFWGDKGVEVVRYAKMEEVYIDLKVGRLDGSLSDYWETYGSFLTTPDGKGYRYVGGLMYGKTADEKSVIGEGIGIAVRKKDQDLKEALNRALAAIRANGNYDQIRKKYFTVDIYGN